MNVGDSAALCESPSVWAGTAVRPGLGLHADAQPHSQQGRGKAVLELLWQCAVSADTRSVRLYGLPSAAWSTGLIRGQHSCELSRSTKWDSKHSLINGPRKDASSIIQEGHIKVS